MMDGFNNYEDIVAEISHKKNRMTTCTISNQEEAQIVKDLAKLEKSLPAAKELQPIQPQLKDLKSQKNALFGELKVKRALADGKDVEIKKFKEIMDS